MGKYSAMCCMYFFSCVFPFALGRLAIFLVLMAENLWLIGVVIRGRDVTFVFSSKKCQIPLDDTSTTLFCPCHKRSTRYDTNDLSVPDPELKEMSDRKRNRYPKKELFPDVQKVPLLSPLHVQYRVSHGVIG